MNFLVKGFVKIVYGGLPPASNEAAVANFDKLVETWTAIKTDWEQAVDRHQQAIGAVSDKISADSDRYTQALFGDVYEQVVAFFDEQSPELWEAFQTDIQTHFRLIAAPPEVPDDGRCRQCGHVEDVEQAGKAPESSD